VTSTSEKHRGWHINTRLPLIVSCLLLLGETLQAQCPTEPVISAGEATYYTFADGTGNCLFDATPFDLMIGAMNDTDYANSAVCGECVSLTGPDGTIMIRIVDRCPECAVGDIDLSPEAFSLIADLSRGRVPITWHVVPCDVTGPIEYHFKDGSNQWWTAVQIRNHRHAIAGLEYLDGQGTFVPVNRVQYNYFVEPAGMGPGPYTFRVTDIYGHVLVDSGVPHIENGSVAGHAQFPECDSALTAVSAPGTPAEFSLSQNYPNPWNPMTTIRYGVPRPVHVTITLYNTLGEEVSRPVNEFKQAGNYTARFSGDGLPGGVYYYRMQAGSSSLTRKLVLLR
jgi:expansin (peptidoglycan-binding protein)